MSERDSAAATAAAAPVATKNIWKDIMDINIRERRWLFRKTAVAISVFEWRRRRHFNASKNRFQLIYCRTVCWALRNDPHAWFYCTSWKNHSFNCFSGMATSWCLPNIKTPVKSYKYFRNIPLWPLRIGLTNWKFWSNPFDSKILFVYLFIVGVGHVSGDLFRIYIWLI